MFLMRRLHGTRSCASSSDNSLSDKSCLVLSNHLRFGLPLLLFRGTVLVFSSQYMRISLHPTFLHFLGYFSHLRCPSNCWSCNRLVYFPNMHCQINMYFLLLHSFSHIAYVCFGSSSAANRLNFTHCKIIMLVQVCMCQCVSVLNNLLREHTCNIK